MEANEIKSQENKMGILPINRLLISVSVPIMLSMLIQALYNIVDSMFVSWISEDALTAVSLAFPIQNLMIAVATGTGVGINAMLSKSLGKKRFEEANLMASNGVFLGICSAMMFAVLGVFFSRIFFLAQTDVVEIVNRGTSYIQICTICSVGLFISVTFERLLQSTGKTIYSMIMQMVGAVINIIFDPIFIFVFDMGVVGAAWATVLGQIVSAILGICLNAKKNTEISLNFKGFRPNWSIIKCIYSVGIPSIIITSIGSVMTFGLNKILIDFTTTATAFFGIYSKLQSFIFMPVFGLNNGMVPIIAYNFGAKKPDRMMKTVKLANLYAASIMVLGTVAFQLIPDRLLNLFKASDYMLGIGIPALKIIGIHFVLAGFGLVSCSFFQSIGHGGLSLIIGLVRQLIVLLPMAWLLSLSGQLELVWWAFPVAELFSVILSAVLLIYTYRKDVKPLQNDVVQNEQET